MMHRDVVAASGAAALLGCAISIDASCADTVDVLLAAAPINAGATGRAALVALGERTQVTIIVSGTPPQYASRPVHLYTSIDEGTCAAPALRTRYALTTRVLADTSSGGAAGPLTITNVAPASLDALRRGGYAIRVRTAPADGDRELFCGEIR